ncbi:MAG TPA: hypothetical protein VNN07_00320 [Candidatus Tectomicrobia bacterium]|nr:hypothetical protein [Candidatus Tectomicrobia bacterium]
MAGIWLMVAPVVLGYGEPASANDRIVGPLVASIAIVAMWEVVRGLRWLNVPLAAWLVAAPWVLEYPAAAAASTVLTGLAIGGLACLGGRVTQQFGGGWRSLGAPGRERRRRTRSARRPATRP